MAETVSQEEAIFHAALEIDAAEKRSAYLDAACGAQSELRRRVEALLRRYAESAGPLDRPACGAIVTTDEPVVERPGSVIGRYKLKEQIGAGGMGLVFVAEQQQPIKRRVAVKVIKPGMDSKQVIARFEAERQALAMLDHPHIAHVLDAGTTDSGRPYFVMELVKGVPITDYCDQHRLTTRQRLELFIPVCQAVQYAHQKGIIHRDLKPSNVLVTVHDVTPVVKIIDFGIAKAMGQQLTDKSVYTGFSQLVGTPMYMSPEQAGLSGLDVDTRSDIYALGVVLYELLTGTTPFDAETLKKADYDELRRMIREDEPARPSIRLSTLEQDTLATVAECHGVELRRLSQQVRGELDWIVMKCLEKDRNRRYDTASDLAMDVQRYLADQSVLACPPSFGYRLRKLVRRNKGPVLAASLVVLALVGGIVGTSIGLIRADRARRGEEAQRIKAVTQAELARKNERIANEREAETRAVLDFVENKILAAARPEGVEGGLGREVTLRKALEAALPFVEKSFTDQPLIEARLRYTLARSFGYLGETNIALEQLLAAQTLYSKHSAPDHPDALRCMVLLGSTYLELGRPADAVKLHEKTLALRKARLAPDHTDTLVSMHALAKDYAALGRNAEALKLREETLALRKAKLGPDHRDTLRSMHDLANSYEALGRFAEALKLHEATLALRTAKLGRDDRDTLYSMHEAACCYQALGRLAEGRKLQEERLAIMKAKFGPGHPDTIAGTWQLALVLFDQGQHAEALKLHEQALALYESKVGFDHPRTLGCMNTLAANYLTADRLADARKHLDESLKRVAGKDVDPGVIGQLTSVRLRYFQKTKDAAGCRAATEMYENLKRTDSDSLYEAACMRAVTAALVRANDKSAASAKDAAAEADRAMAWLKQAVAAGYNDVEHMKKDNDLDALRDREDFQKLLTDLQAGEEKGKK